MNSTEFKDVTTYLDGKLQSEIQLIRLSGNVEALGEYLSFLGVINALDIMTLLQPSEVSTAFDTLNGSNTYNENYYQKLVVDTVVYANLMTGGWDAFSEQLSASAKTLFDSEFIPENVMDRIKPETIEDPYIATAFLLKDITSTIIIKEARRNVK